MWNRLRPVSIVTILLLLLAFPVSGLADGGGTTSPTPGSTLGKTTATIVGDAVQFRPCSFEVIFEATAPDNNLSYFELAEGRFPTYHNIKGNILAGDPLLSGDLSTCDIDIWKSKVWAVDDQLLSGAASDELTLECRKDRNDIPTAPRFAIRPTFNGAGQSQSTVIGGVAPSCCFTVTLSSSTPGGETDLRFKQVSGSLPPGHRLSGDTISGCTTVTHVSGDIVYTPMKWVSEWITMNNNNRCERSGPSTLTLACGDL